MFALFILLEKLELNENSNNVWFALLSAPRRSCYSLCMQNHAKSYGWIFVKFLS